MKLTGETRSTRRETCLSATLSTTNPTRTDPRSNPDLRGGRPVANRLSHGTAIFDLQIIFRTEFGPVLIMQRLLGSWVRIPPRAWMFVSYSVCVVR
jgi:hypothetical protein